MELPPLLRERAQAFTKACITESLAVARGETTEAEAIDRLTERFFPRLGGVDAKPEAQPA
jgi:hypothetical protein